MGLNLNRRKEVGLKLIRQEVELKLTRKEKRLNLVSIFINLWKWDQNSLEKKRD